MSNSSIFSSNRRFIVTVGLSLLTFFAIDHFLYKRRGFLKQYGYGTHEGQMVGKMERASQLASHADVIFFGSSLLRSGVSSEPFLKRGILPLNMAVSAGGPLYSYFALERLKPVLAQRDRQPVIAIELNPWTLAKEYGADWAEHFHLLGTVRSRQEQLRHYRLLYQNFKAYGMASQFLASLILPSGVYRSYNLGVGSQSLHDLGAMLSGGFGKRRYFWGMEDLGGYAPLYYSLKCDSIPSAGEGLPLTWIPSKVKLLRMFVRTATELGARVVLLTPPTYLTGADVRGLDCLAGELQAEFPGLVYLPGSQYDLQAADFADAHLNLWGADRFATRLIERLSLRGNRDEFVRKWDYLFEQLGIPSFTQWNLCDPSVRVSDLDTEQLDLPIKRSEAHLLAASPPIEVTVGRSYVLEFSVDSDRLPLQVAVRSAHGQEEVIQTQTNEASHWPRHSEARFFLRFNPDVNRIRITVAQSNAVDQSNRRCGVRLVRLVGLRDN